MLSSFRKYTTKVIRKPIAGLLENIMLGYLKDFLISIFSKDSKIRKILRILNRLI